jgi:hypothetical protein
MYRTDLGAGWLIAMHARSWNKFYSHTRKLAFLFDHQIHPRNGSPSSRFIRTPLGYVVFFLTGCDTSAAARAFIQIYNHSPQRHQSYSQKTNFEKQIELKRLSDRWLG